MKSVARRGGKRGGSCNTDNLGPDLDVVIETAQQNKQTCLQD
jgi:hypothetical protein